MGYIGDIQKIVIVINSHTQIIYFFMDNDAIFKISFSIVMGSNTYGFLVYISEDLLNSKFLKKRCAKDFL